MKNSIYKNNENHINVRQFSARIRALTSVFIQREI